MTTSLCRTATALGLVTAGLCLSVLAQGNTTQNSAPGILAGRVVDAKTGKPVDNATVSAAGPQQTLTQQTSGTGEFAFTFDKPVTIRLSAEKAGYLRAYAGQLGPIDSKAQESKIDVPSGARVTAVLLKLWASPAIEGKVRRGVEAVTGATVVVLNREYRGGGFTWHKVPLKSARSDDRGHYRIPALPPGQYLVAVLGDEQGRGRPIFAPGRTAAEAARIVTLDAGSETTDADIDLDFPEPTGSIGGQVLDGERRAKGANVLLKRLNVVNDMTTDFDEFNAVTDESGAFRFSDVPIGSYKLRVVLFPESDQTLLYMDGNFHGYAFGRGRMDNADVPLGGPVPPLPTTPTLIADRDVAVGAPGADALALRLQPAASISGRVIFQDGVPPEPQDLTSIRVLIRPADGSVLGGIPVARIEKDGSFRSVGLPPGDYVVAPLVAQTKPPQSWSTIAMTSGGTDVLGGPIRLELSPISDVLVTMSTKTAEVSGRVVRSSASQSTSPARVIIFPKAERLRTFYNAFPSRKRVVQAEVSFSGAFRAVLPPGEYLAAAITGDLSEFWMSPEYLARLSPRATGFRLALGDKVTVSLEAR